MVNPSGLPFVSNTEVNLIMKELLQAIDIKKWGSKIISSALIVSMLMIDVAKAMNEEEHDPLLIHNPLSLKLSPADHEVTIEIIDDFSPRQNSILDDADSSTGSISASPEKSTPESDKSLAIIPFPGLSFAFPQSNDVSPPQLEVIKSQPSSPSVHSSPTSESSGDFNPFAVGAFELHKLGIDHRTTITVDENPQLQLSSSMGNDIASSIGSSLMRGGSLQDRSPPFIPPSQTVAESSRDNSKPVVPVPDFILSPADPLGSSSDTDSAEDMGISFLGKQPNIPRSPNMQIKGSKRNLFSAPAAVCSRQPFTSENSKLLDPTLSLKYSSIQGDDRRDDPSPSSNPLGDPEVHNLPVIQDDSKCCSCCPSNRPLLPQPTEYTLPDALDKIRTRSKLLLIAPTSNDHSVSSSHDFSDSFSFEESDSSSPHGSPPKDLGVGGVLLPSDDDDPDVTFDNSTHSATYPAITDDQGFVNLRNPFRAPIDASLLPSHHSLLPAHDLESGEFVPPSMSSQATFKHLLDDLKKFPPAAQSQLKDFIHQVLNGKSTWPQRLGKYLIGPLIAAGFAWAMGPIYDGGILYLGSLNEAINNFLKGQSSGYLIYYIMWSAVPDGVSRNAHLWKEGIAYLFQEGKEKGRMCAAGAISALTAFIPLAYLISAENIGRQLSGLTGWNNGFGDIIAIFGPPIYLDAFASDFNIAWNALPQMKEWLGKLFCRQSSARQLSFLEENLPKAFDKNLKYLERFLFQAPKAVIDEIYDNIKQVKEGAQVPCCDNYDEALASQQAFAVLSYLLYLSDDVVKGASKPKSIYDISADIFKYACLILGSPARAVTLQFIGYSVFSLFCSNPVAQVLGGIYALLAFLPQTFMEDQGMDNFFKRFLVTEDPDGHKAHPIYRGITKLFCSLQGLIYGFPLAVATLQGFQQWSGAGWWPLLVGIPFLIPEIAAQTYSFNGTFNQLVATSAINGCHKIGGKCKKESLCSPCKKDWLVRFVQTSREDLNHWHPDLIQKLTEGISIFKREG